MLQNNTSKHKKVTIYVPPELYKELKLDLIKKDVTVTAWFGEQVRKYLVGQDRKK